MQINRKKKTVFIVMILFISGSLSIVLAESILKIISERDLAKSGSINQFIRIDNLLGWKGTSNCSGYFQHSKDTPKTFVRHNSKGFRDDERQYKSAKKKRILLLGDSFGWGYGVNQDEMMSMYLGKLLGDNYEVINLCIFGYSTDQELLLLEKEGMKYTPDIVCLLFFIGNDFTGNNCNVMYNYYKPRYTFDNDKLTLNRRFHDLPFKRKFNIFMQEKSYLYLRLLKAFKKKIGAGFVVHPDLIIPTNPELTFALIKKMNDFLSSRNTRMLFVIIPVQSQVIEEQYASKKMEYEKTANALLVNELKKLNIEYLDLLDLFCLKIKQDKDISLYNKDSHWSKEGNYFVAEQLKPKVLKMISEKK